MRVALNFLLFAFLFGCSTSYQEMGFSGGVESQKLSSDVARISASGNAFTSSSTIADYVLVRAAEETIASGFGHFEVYDESDQSRSGYVVSPGSATTSYSGYQSTTTFSPPIVTSFRKPGSAITIKMYSGRKPGNAPPNVFDAQEVIEFVGPRVF